ncbi:type II toxin-antitoxin system VapC family toxin [Modestobacter sp. Leaf380]|uniref:type II toxin-antitoxin system VapC family toxin n=1 Tax=Modestobacter sp. Leaf380 TaxID=1736356 RepID=UPI0006FDCF7A|nr:type II toxin-antitoxin system VapC family toxin [Modestobacter sp. Leaf380]KQS66628.1 hypothetical protein ASG41_09125 [Modestobacter sp. Leaf380]
MRFLLDTHVLVRWAGGDESLLPDPVRRALADSTDDVFFSAVTTAELAVESALGKLDVADHLLGTSPDESFTELPLTSAHAAVLAHLPPHHRDPSDRMLIAQALVEGLVLVTVDDSVHRYDVPVSPPR